MSFLLTSVSFNPQTGSFEAQVIYLSLVALDSWPLKSARMGSSGPEGSVQWGQPWVWSSDVWAPSAVGIAELDLLCVPLCSLRPGGASAVRRGFPLQLQVLRGKQEEKQKCQYSLCSAGLSRL